MIRLRGTLRADTAARAREAVAGALATAPAVVVLDMNAVTADDALGLWVLPAVAGNAERGGTRLVIAASSRVLRVRLRRLGVRCLDITDTVPPLGAVLDAAPEPSPSRSARRDGDPGDVEPSWARAGWGLGEFFGFYGQALAEGGRGDSPWPGTGLPLPPERRSPPGGRRRVRVVGARTGPRAQRGHSGGRRGPPSAGRRPTGVVRGPVSGMRAARGPVQFPPGRGAVMVTGLSQSVKVMVLCALPARRSG